MTIELSKLIKLSVDDLELELDSGSYSLEQLSAALEGERSNKDRKTAVDAYENAIANLPESKDEIIVAPGKSIGFRAGIKAAGSVVDLDWPEFKANDKLLAEMLDNGLLVYA